MGPLLLQTKILLPQLLNSRIKVANNQSVHLAHQESVITVNVFQFLDPGVYLLVDIFKREYFLKLPGAKVDIDKEFVLSTNSISKIDSLNEGIKLKWEKHPRKVTSITPEEIASSWKNSLYYKEEDPDNNTLGLRKPQLGAIHAIASHWSTSNETATVVMPTGTGKTEVMLSVLVSEQCERTIVIVPSSILRDQIYNKFLKLGCLSDVGVIKDSVQLPKVAKITTGINDPVKVMQLVNESNVFIATAAVLSNFSGEALKTLTESCTHLFIDEAHHVPANTWDQVITLFKGRRILQFTATPFRNDGKRVAGKIIYDYPLGMAQKGKYFKPINLIRISEFIEEKADKAVAEKAIEKLRADLALDPPFDHLLMARASSITRAVGLLALYEELAPDLKPFVINNTLSSAEKREYLKQLQTRESRIVICVDMLGEGFDLPNLKIAAMHDIHKSLPVTMQFVGRFTRISSDHIGDATVVVNIADPKVDKRLEALYSENADWNELLKQESETAIGSERRIQEVVHNFTGALFDQISLWNLRPSYSTLIYKTNSEDWSPEEMFSKIPESIEIWPAVNNIDYMIVLVISREDTVSWGRYRDISNHSFELCVVYWNKEQQKLFFQCSNYDAFNIDQMAKALCGESTEIYNGMRLFSVFKDVELPIVKNLGVSKTGSISYTQYLGPEVNFGLSAIDRADSTPNNVFGWGYENGEIVTYGCSARSGKVWSRGGGTIVNFKDWCDRIEPKIPENADLEVEVIQGFLRPIPLNGRYPFVAHTVDWGDKLLQTAEKNVTLFFDHSEYKLHEVDIKVINFNPTGPIEIEISAGSIISQYNLIYDLATGDDEVGGYRLEYVTGHSIYIKRSSGIKLNLIEYEKKDPFMVRYVDGSFSFANYLVPLPSPEGLFDLNNLVPVTWTVDITKESQGKDRNPNTIQYQVIQSILDEYDIVINDDDKGEAADIIAVRNNPSTETYTFHLFHCKFSHTENPGADIRNMYEVCGQAQKSVKWKHRGIEGFVEHLKPREEKWTRTGHTRFIKGNLVDLVSIKRISKYSKMEFKMTIVQPGLSKAVATEHIAQLLASTESYVLKTTRAQLEVICSE